jgi:hypothetical protein
VGEQGFRRGQALGVICGKIDHETDGRTLHEVAAADSQTPDFHQPGQIPDGTDHNFLADCRQMDTVVADQNGPFDYACAARHD